MRAKLVENQNFERGQDPKEAMDIGLKPPTEKELKDFLFTKEDEISNFIGELMDSIFLKYPKADEREVTAMLDSWLSESVWEHYNES